MPDHEHQQENANR